MSGTIVTGEDTEGGNKDNPSITLNNIKKTDAGDYVCVLENGAGQSQSEVLSIEVLCKFLT